MMSIFSVSLTTATATIFAFLPKQCDFSFCASLIFFAKKTHFINLVKTKWTSVECGPMPNVIVTLPNIGGALCSTPQSLVDAHYIKNSQRQSCSAINCLSIGVNILAGVALFPWYLNAKGLTRIGSTCVAHTSPHSAAAVTSLRH